MLINYDSFLMLIPIEILVISVSVSINVCSWTSRNADGNSVEQTTSHTVKLGVPSPVRSPEEVKSS